MKSAYSMCKPLWDKISELVATGLSAQVACDMVYQAYGSNLPVTTILRKMKVDRRTGRWPARIRVRAE